MFKFRTLSVAMFAALLALPVAAHAQAGAGKDKDKGGRARSEGRDEDDRQGHRPLYRQQLVDGG